MERGQFTFYSSIYLAAKMIKNKSARADFYDCVCEYALNGTMPNLEKLSDAAAVGFVSVKPNLDASRRKAQSGRTGGKSKQTASKQQANESNSEAEKEKEKEKELEIENEIENEYLIDNSGGGDTRGKAQIADESVLARIGLKKNEIAFPVYVSDVDSVEFVTKEIVRKYFGREYTVSDCKNVFTYAVKFDPDKGAYFDRTVVGILSYAMEQALLAGKQGSWRYVTGILERLHNRGITTVEQAVYYDQIRMDEE